MDDLDDLYCIVVKRYGALGIEEETGRLSLHAVERDEVEDWLRVTLDTLGPGDRAEVTLTRGRRAQ